MKKLLLAVACCVATVAALAQPQLNWGSQVSSAGLKFTFSEAGTGALLGDTYVAGLMWGKAADSLAPAQSGGVPVVLPFKMKSGVGSGVYSTGSLVSIDGTDWGQAIYLQVVAYDKNAPSYAAAIAPGSGYKAGASDIIPFTLPSNATEPIKTLDALNGKSFTVDAVVIPEPSILALGLLGGVAFLLRRRS
ncbi:MAG TPA: PEP-CTERM sorting domain-containing protein [Verrucomicrobiota bacterium]|nr:PEP-CTERM sorting domain-containing protein [Verrucomicrobiota bacterium]HNU51958.1 PEP-CTERM sorting domain-containing protein [Verrucomicrobiota bacterium]